MKYTPEGMLINVERGTGKKVYPYKFREKTCVLPEDAVGSKPGNKPWKKHAAVQGTSGEVII